jgi:hypothetical protein
MTYDFTGLKIYANNEVCKKAADLFAEEIMLRTGKIPNMCAKISSPSVVFKLCEPGSLTGKDSYNLSLQGSVLNICAIGLRGLIFGFSYFLRKTIYENERITLIKDISGDYNPAMKIRGHQLGYRTTPNTYDAWSFDDYYRYYRDMMFFGCNTCEQMPNEGKKQVKNRLMKYDVEELLIEASRMADELDMDVSVWYPNNEESIEDAVARRKEVFKKVPRLDVVFPPGGDPGEFEADEFLERCIAISKALKEVHPKAEMWPSAQKPHSIPDWGNDFIEYISSLPDEIDGVITGPNRAFPLDELRRKLPMKYPIRLYPDITHNVRCEYPVHFNRDDWHYSLTNALSRECINPRPTEYRLIHRLTRRYIVGSVSYSEGVSDDINKMVWSDMDFFPDVPLYETLLDYARVFMPGIPANSIADGILGLEMNWQGDPAENPHIESTLNSWLDLLNKHPKLINNWRFVQCLFRAKCDALVRRRRCFETALIENANIEILRGNLPEAYKILSSAFDKNYNALHDDIFALADRLFHQIGIQLDVEHYCADSWQRGATLDTIDLPVTDRQWLLNKVKAALDMPQSDGLAFIARVLNRNKVENDEYYFSLAEHGFDVLGIPQNGEFYINYQGDRPDVNNGDIPMSMLKLYDHYSFRCKIGGFMPGVDYKLRVTYSSQKIPLLNHHKVTANGVTVYDGPQYGGEKDDLFDKELLAPRFESATYPLPASLFVNGCLDLEIGEPIAGVMLSEFWIIKA